jgi:hypothetical protein
MELEKTIRESPAAMGVAEETYPDEYVLQELKQ